jgi:hypothetical protein
LQLDLAVRSDSLIFFSLDDKPVKTVFVCLALIGWIPVCTGTTARSTRELTKAVDALCGWTGIKRTEPLRLIKVSKERAYPEFVIQTNLVVDGVRRDYVIKYDDDLSIIEFYPDGDWGWFRTGAQMRGELGDDRVKDVRWRSLGVVAVSRLQKHLSWKYYGPPTMIWWGHDLLVTFRTITEGEERRRGLVIFHPWVSFAVTRRGTLFAGFWGS